jgi:hypothetical protein
MPVPSTTVCACLLTIERSYEDDDEEDTQNTVAALQRRSFVRDLSDFGEYLSENTVVHIRSIASEVDVFASFPIRRMFWISYLFLDQLCSANQC